MRKLMIVLYIFSIGHIAFAQDAYWVFFTDKNNTCFDPFSYFDSYAIERRIQNNISLYDSTDFPLTSSYVEKVTLLAEEVLGETRWFNALAIFATEENFLKIQTFPFVREIVPIRSSLMLCQYRDLISEQEVPVSNNNIDSSKTIFASAQVQRMEGDSFIEKGIDGKGIRIAVFDGGFPEVDTHIAFEHLRKNNKIIKTWNFCNKKEDVYGYSSHGRMVLSCIAGIKGNQKLGLATGAEFLLARTEVEIERYKEEVWWLMAAEWADKNGAHIINSSLGYGGERYYPSQMDGKYSLVTRAANMAASKGILVVNAAGNEGTDKEWNRSIIAPADADSILTIGGIFPMSDYRINFSSVGPTADGRLKPNVVAWGQASVAGKTEWVYRVSGTSFSSPLVAGFAACAWQTNPNLTNMQLKTEIERSADLYPYFDYDLGYGVPQAGYFINGKKTTIDPDAITILEAENTIQIILNHSPEKDSLHEKKYRNQGYIYYHVQDEKGVLVKYLVLSVPQQESGYDNWNKKDRGDSTGNNENTEESEPKLEKTIVLAQVEKSELKPGYILRVCYNGIVKEYSK